LLPAAAVANPAGTDAELVFVARHQATIGSQDELGKRKTR
jgi:hypothetical protein